MLSRKAFKASNIILDVLRGLGGKVVGIPLISRHAGQNSNPSEDQLLMARFFYRIRRSIRTLRDILLYLHGKS